MAVTKKYALSNFFQLMSAVFLIFIFAALLGEMATDFVLHYNDKNVEKTFHYHISFWGLAVLFSGVWSWVWVWFKKSEKVCVDYWLSRTNRG